MESSAFYWKQNGTRKENRSVQCGQSVSRVSAQNRARPMQSPWHVYVRKNLKRILKMSNGLTVQNFK